MLSTDKNIEWVLQTVTFPEFFLYVDNKKFNHAYRTLTLENIFHFLPFAQITWHKQDFLLPVWDVWQRFPYPASASDTAVVRFLTLPLQSVAI